MQSYFLDTNFLFGLLNNDDYLYESANALFDSFSENTRLITSSLVVAELMCSGENYDFVHALTKLQVEIIEVEMSDVARLPEFIDPSKRRSLKAIDSIILTQCYIYDLKLVSFDKKLTKFSLV